MKSMLRVSSKFRINSGAAELDIQGIRLHTLILEVQSYKTLENRDLFIFFLAVAYSDLDCFRRPCYNMLQSRVLNVNEKVILRTQPIRDNLMFYIL